MFEFDGILLKPCLLQACFHVAGFVCFFPKPAEATTDGRYREIGLLTRGQRERTSFYNGAERRLRKQH